MTHAATNSSFCLHCRLPWRCVALERCAAIRDTGDNHLVKMASNIEQRLLALEQGLLRVAALEQSHAQIAELHDMVSSVLGWTLFEISQLTNPIRYKLSLKKSMKMGISIPRKNRNKSPPMLVERRHQHLLRAPKKYRRPQKLLEKESPSPHHLLVKAGKVRQILSLCNLRG